MSNFGVPVEADETWSGMLIEPSPPRCAAAYSENPMRNPFRRRKQNPGLICAIV
jgi:hypothetical protein